MVSPKERGRSHDVLLATRQQYVDGGGPYVIRYHMYGLDTKLKICVSGAGVSLEFRQLLLDMTYTLCMEIAHRPLKPRASALVHNNTNEL